MSTCVVCYGLGTVASDEPAMMMASEPCPACTKTAPVPTPAPKALTKDGATGILTLAGFTVTKMWELMNQYWPRTYLEDVVQNPWWLVRTKEISSGLVMIGRRKSVFHLDWSDTAIRFIVTADDVTKSDTYVHAWTIAKAVEYMANLHQHVEIR
jgi:hypothetical protein